MSDEMWEMKKFLAKKKGDAASSKIMMPTVMIFLGILIMILVPMLSGIEI
jgi:tight adherence protein C